MNRNQTIENCKTFAGNLQDKWTDLTERRMRIIGRKLDRWINNIRSGEQDVLTSIQSWMRGLTQRWAEMRRPKALVVRSTSEGGN